MNFVYKLLNFNQSFSKEQENSIFLSFSLNVYLSLVYSETSFLKVVNDTNLKNPIATMNMK